MSTRTRRINFERNGMFFCLFKVEVTEVFVRRRRGFSAKLTKIFYGFKT